VKIFSRGTLRDFWEKHGDCKLQLKTWYREAEKSNWSSINQLKLEYPSASILKDNRIVFLNLILSTNLHGYVLLERMLNMTKLTQTKFRMNIKPIRNETDYQKALERLEQIFDAKKGTKDGDELEILAIVIDNYENEHFPIGMPDPISAIKFRMEQMGLKQKDLVDMIGFKSRVSEIMNKKRKLTLEMIRKLNAKLHIPTDVLIQDY